MNNLAAGDTINFRDGRLAIEQGVDRDAVGVVLRAYDLPATAYRVDVQFPGREPSRGWHQAVFVSTDTAG